MCTCSQDNESEGIRDHYLISIVSVVLCYVLLVVLLCFEAILWIGRGRLGDPCPAKDDPGTAPPAPRWKHMGGQYGQESSCGKALCQPEGGEDKTRLQFCCHQMHLDAPAQGPLSPPRCRQSQIFVPPPHRELGELCMCPVQEPPPHVPTSGCC